MGWGRNGKVKRRFVFYDDAADCLVWKNATSAKDVAGVLPIHKIQDISVGVSTPVLHRIRHPKLRPDRAWSIVALDRTLDLQAESPAERDQWVAALKSCYKRHVERFRQAGGDQGPDLPPHYRRKVKVYP